MNERFEHELSQFLDGRLPSGRREQILERLADDPDAANLLDEMERAQDLARSLPSHRIGRSFSESLWERIRAGEGTPDAVFREPLPLWTKARYVAAGAAAAALTIAALQVLLGDRPAEDPLRSPEVARATEHEPAPSDPAPSEPAPSADDRRLRPADPDRLATPVFQPLLPQTVAQAGQSECFEAVATLQHRAADVERRIAGSDARDLVVELDPVAGRARGSAELIRWMQREQLVELRPEFDTTLALTERILERLERATTHNDATQLRVAVQDLQDLQLDGLRQKFNVICCTSPQDFLAGLREQIQRSADVRRALRFVVTTSGSAASTIEFREIEMFDADPFGGRFLVLQGLHGIDAMRIQGPAGSSQVEVHVRRTTERAPDSTAPRTLAPRGGR